MRCPKCNCNNVIGASYCTGCGSKLEITSERAHVEAVAEVSHENWQRACRALGRTLFLFVLVFSASLIFRAYANREIIAEFSASAPLPRLAPMSLPTLFIQSPKLAIPTIDIQSNLAPEKDDEKVILAERAETARYRLRCRVAITGTTIIQGTMLCRNDKEVRIIVGWPKTAKDNPKIRTISMADVDLKGSDFPE